jgi:hypothetical protein
MVAPARASESNPHSPIPHRRALQRDLHVSKRSDAFLSGTDPENAEFVPVDLKRSTGREGEDYKTEKANLLDRTFHQVK